MILDEPDDPHAVTAPEPKSIVQFFQESPLVGVELDLQRDKDTGREVELQS
jgi:hypothetical protein